MEQYMTKMTMKAPLDETTTMRNMTRCPVKYEDEWPFYRKQNLNDARWNTTSSQVSNCDGVVIEIYDLL